jgi:hypothetical protein
MNHVRKIEFNKEEEGATEQKECKMSPSPGFLNGVVRVTQTEELDKI